MKSNDGGTNALYDYLIIGAGPAGLQLGYYMEKAGSNYLILEAGESPGTFFKKFPRHRKLISINKVYTGYDDTEINLRWDWNSLLSDSEEMLFKHFTKRYFPDADAFVDYLAAFARHFDLKVRCNVEVTRVSRDGVFTVHDQQGHTYRAKRLIVATGLSRLYEPKIPGIELAEKYTEVSVDPEDFVNQKVLVIGKGNSGFETADNLVETATLIHVVSPNPVSFAWKTKFVGHLRAINNNFLDTYQLKSQNVVLDACVDKIERTADGRFLVSFSYGHANGETEDLVYDRVILCTGWKFDASIFDENCRPALAINDKFPAQTSEYESVNVKDLYVAGTLMQMRDYKKKQSGFIHGFRYNVEGLHKILARKYEDAQIPCRTLEPSPSRLMEEVIRRTNVSSGLWQQTGYICDLIVVDEAQGVARYYDDLPVDYVHDSDFGKEAHYYVVTLEFGLDVINAAPDPFQVERIHKDDFANAHLSSGIHPIVRRYSRGKLVSEHHVIEDIASEWLEEVHTAPLSRYFEAAAQG